MKTFLIIAGIVILVLGLTFAINIFLVHGFIWAAQGIFEKDFSDKFWHLFVMLIIIQSIFGCAKATLNK